VTGTIARALGAALALAALGTGPAADARATQSAPPAQAPPARDLVLEQRTKELASELRCPVCQGLSLQDSPSELAQQMRDVVRTQLAEGKTPDQVKRYFVDKYGEWILLEPKATGFNVLVYALPVGGVLVGFIVIAFAVRRWTTGAGPEHESGA
jgi:cytochrome c-type biogenesis protein CcmH